MGDYCIDEIIHLLEAIAKCVYSTIFSVIYSATKPWSLRFGEKVSQIHVKILFLADFFGSAACLTESGFMDCKEKFSLHSKAPANL